MTIDTLILRLESDDFDATHAQIRKLDGVEAISRPFRFDVDVVCADAELDAAEVVGASVSIVFEIDEHVVRTLHGIVVALEDMLDAEPAHRSYHLEIGPRAARSALVETQDIFQDLTVPDIVKQKLELVGLGATDVESRLTSTYPAREFVVQYKETDLAFISRLTEHVGISFFFEQGDVDKLVLADDASSFRPLENGAGGVVPFRGRGEHRDVYALSRVTRMAPKTFVEQDYNYRTPRLELTSTFKSDKGLAGGVVEYGAHVKTPEEAIALAKIRAAERAAETSYFKGRCADCRFTAGATITLDGHAKLGDAPLLLTEVRHRATQAVLTNGASGDVGSYENEFRAVDGATAYRPPRVTPRPRIHGVLTGLVEPRADGAVGSQAEIDDSGRYTVRFFFDTSPPDARRRSSRPIRMLQPLAGPNYGVHFPLRPGVEVAVTFVDGDPDRPLIQGAAPNPVTPSSVVRRNASYSRIDTVSGISFVMKDR